MNSGMGLERVDKLHSLTQAYTQPTQSGYCIVGTPLVLGRGMGNTDTLNSPWPGLEGSHHFPFYSIVMVSHEGYIQMAFLPQDSQVGVPKSRQLGFSQLWSLIPLRPDLESRCGLKQNCSSHQELFNIMWYALYSQVNWVDS